MAPLGSNSNENKAKNVGKTYKVESMTMDQNPHNKL